MSPPQECTLEAVPKSEYPSSYAYALPDEPTYNTHHQQIPWTQQSPIQSDNGAKAPPASKSQSRFLRWPALILYALLIAVLAGTIGGFVGESITKNKQGTLSPSPTPTSPASLSASPTPSPSPSSSASPTPTLFQRTLPVPTTGCTPPTQQRSFKSVTRFLAAQYTTYCATGWLNDELFALSAATTSDCIEACVMYNGHKRSEDRSCVGGGFIPEWWNQSKAMEESGGMPYNCFLKSGDKGTGRNEKGVEVVALCLGGACGDVLGGGGGGKL